MDAALVFTWKTAFVGREKLALEFSVEAMEFWAKKATDGLCTEVEYFVSSSAPVSFAMVKGEFEFLRDLMGTDEFTNLVSKGTLLLNDWHYYLYYTGDRGMKVIGEYGKVGAELGVI